MFRKRRGLWFALVVVLVAAAAAGYYYYSQIYVSAQAPEEPEIRTTRVRRGDLIISATGAGTVIAAEEIELGFQTSGTLTEVSIQVGDKVRAGDVLARIDDVNARKALTSAELGVLKAQLDLDSASQDHVDLVEGASVAELLDARAAVKAAEEKLADLRAGSSAAEIATAEADVSSAREAYKKLFSGPDAQELARAQASLEKAKNSLWSSQMSRDSKGDTRNKASGAYDQAQVSVLNAEISVRLAEMDLAELQEPATQAELQGARARLLQAEEKLSDLKTGASEAEIASAEAQLAQAEERLADLEAGASEAESALSEGRVRQADLNLASAQATLEAAQQDLEDTTLFAPAHGTVIAVAAEVGERVGNGSETLITLADLSQPLLEVFVDETDMDKIAVGYEVEVELDAIPDELFTGTVIQVDPALIRDSGVDVLRGIVSLGADSFSKPQDLPLGLNATVDIIGGRAENALLVPVEALRELDPGEYAVFVVEEGKPRMRLVEVGLMDLTYAEIRSGLEAGDTVSTGIVETR